ncbi:DeoR/GlpR family transcriptional regulator of sugar metabolism [Paenibacillus anaericanus]|uniref:DeoR/GlpR family DNA-binding transcription regulator n=1 Tax=Paenibacillus anaericanus TaxID=170367 RepID=UPI00277D56E8|nr:DeoR/GlpR family DNA-binding transcription regulator [Paenibacillus anaericanus]MDQ0089700.1 DeoR/GlpR family transcriptional regulator of sugar metabolism [Paenibacillus anaericanus]
MSILAEERKLIILEQLRSAGQVKVLTLAERLCVSEETVRRDLKQLENEGLLNRVYGGAIPQKFSNYEPPYIQRQAIYKEDKQRIGEAAAELVKSGDTIAIDVGTTLLEFAKAIQGRQRLTILTNSLAVSFCLMESLNMGRFTGKVIIIGGELNPQQQSLSGVIGEEMMKQFTVDKAFLSAGGITTERGISDYDIHECRMSKLFAQSANEVIVLADHSKLGKDAFVQIIPLEAVNTIVSDTSPPEPWLPLLNDYQMAWIQT